MRVGHYHDTWLTTPEEAELVARIRTIKAILGRELLILTHHYQRPEIVALGDYRGDSFALSQKAAWDQDARYIVFCGVPVPQHV